jgi:hypothetical protein
VSAALLLLSLVSALMRKDWRAKLAEAETAELP